MIKLLLLIVVIVSQTSTCLAAGERTATTIRRDITESICRLNFMQQFGVYLDYCKSDGFNFCGQ